MKETIRRKLIKKYTVKNKGFIESIKSFTKRKTVKRHSGKHIFPRRLNEDAIVNIIAAVVLVLLAIYVKRLLFDAPKKGNINPDNMAAFSLSPDAFSSIRELSEKYKIDFYEMLSLYLIECSFYPNKEANIRTKEEIEQVFIVNYKSIKGNYKNKTVKQYSEMLKNIFGEIKYFPLMSGFEANESESYIYGDSWGQQREYKGSRAHKGCDILDRENIRGRIPVCSMTDGVVENIGWNELGGYRIGIRTQSGTYYYYAHLNRFAEGLDYGSEINAGQLIGYMGDTGYSKKEGTQGNFAVHLHVGISPETKVKKDYWINPYPFLRFIESSKSEYIKDAGSMEFDLPLIAG